SQVMTAGFVNEARAHGIDVGVVRSAADVTSWGDAAVVTGGWTTAKGVLSAIDATPNPPVRGVFLAPWLLSAAVTDGPGRVQVAVGLPFDPSASTATAYLAEVARRAPGAA